jgi:hypothetical protein
MTYSCALPASLKLGLGGAAVSHSAEPVRGHFTSVEEGPLIRPFGAPSPQGEKGRTSLENAETHSVPSLACIASHSRWGRTGTRVIRTPVAWRMAERIAGAVAIRAGSPTPLAPNGPRGSASSIR